MSPAASIAANTICIVKPSAAPIRNWLTMIHTPCAENTVATGIGGSVGATTSAMKPARPIFTRTGVERWPVTGAIATSASIRTNGHRKAVSQPFSCA
ncbi:regulator [Burkholderia pseudomallei]|nr:regulator [Burkholderia pseudomallei]